MTILAAYIRALGPLYTWRIDAGLSGWTIAEACGGAHGRPVEYWARLYYDIEQGRHDPHDPMAGPLWQYVWNHGGEGLDLQQLAWWRARP